jgi:hypothetical protein
MVQQCVRAMAPFNITLSRLRVVQHANDACLWLEPDEESSKSILHVRNELFKRFPTLSEREEFGNDGCSLRNQFILSFCCSLSAPPESLHSCC